MRTKIIIAITACLFAAVSVANMHLAQNDHNSDISLADISVMAQADGESGDPQWKCKCSWWIWGNKECRADNGGKSCHYDEANCREHDPLCGT